jgi:hydrogenase large subunit
MSAHTVVVDPVTRIEGHLRIEADTDETGRITRASSSGTMVRGIELVLKGRDPRDAWAFAQRICGVCTLVHGMASVRAVEDALGIEIPPNASLIRNLLIAAQHVHDHVMHFYHLHALDWVDPVSALAADPAKTAALAQGLSSYGKSSPGAFADVRARLQRFVDAGRLGIFAKGYWGHPAYKLPPEANLLALSHYFDALAWQREVAQLQAIFGGKSPHPNLLVGGMPCAISVDSPAEAHGGQAATAVNIVGLQRVQAVIRQMRDFVEQVYLPDVLAIASFYKDWARIGEGTGNFLCYGDLDGLIPAGAILGRNLKRIQAVDLRNVGHVQEFVAHSWYGYKAGKDIGLHPWHGETKLAYSGPKPPVEHFDADASYSWIKSPRWRGHPMEVGPLARVLMLYAQGHAETREITDAALKQLDLPVEALYSTIGRTAARAIEAKIFAGAMQGWYDRLIANIKAGDLKTVNDAKWDPATWPKRAQGVGFMEAPRGALGHWLVIEDGKIANYQAVVPSTWNAGPRDAEGNDGPYEAALKGHVLADSAQPIEILRTIHSFDPCIACAVHVAGSSGGGIQIRTG